MSVRSGRSSGVDSTRLLLAVACEEAHTDPCRRNDCEQRHTTRQGRRPALRLPDRRSRLDPARRRLNRGNHRDRNGRADVSRHVRNARCRPDLSRTHAGGRGRRSRAVREPMPTRRPRSGSRSTRTPRVLDECEHEKPRRGEMKPSEIVWRVPMLTASRVTKGVTATKPIVIGSVATPPQAVTCRALRSPGSRC